MIVLVLGGVTGFTVYRGLTSIFTLVDLGDEFTVHSPVKGRAQRAIFSLGHCGFSTSISGFLGRSCEPNSDGDVNDVCVPNVHLQVVTGTNVTGPGLILID